MIPTKAGWYFAKWRIANDGTRDGDELTPSDKIECVDVFENTLDPDDDEHLLVHVAGVERGQSVENFFWIGPVSMPSATNPHYGDPLKNGWVTETEDRAEASKKRDTQSRGS